MNMERNEVAAYLASYAHRNPHVTVDIDGDFVGVSSKGSPQSWIVAYCGRDVQKFINLTRFVGHGMLTYSSCEAEDTAQTGASEDQSSSNLYVINSNTDDPAAISDAIRKKPSSMHKLRLGQSVQGEADSAKIIDFGAGNVLLFKICGALTDTYDALTVAKVGQLVSHNTFTTTPLDLGVDKLESLTEDELGDSVAYFLEEFLVLERRRSVYINSNEPVLLVNTFGKISTRAFDKLVSATLEQLQSTYNIWPVRVYAGCFVAGKKASFSVSLLNVTNTDIGGPSMIQLLDAPCDAPGWLGCSRREVWNGRELLDKHVQYHEEDAFSADTPMTATTDEDEEVAHALEDPHATIGEGLGPGEVERDFAHNEPSGDDQPIQSAGDAQSGSEQGVDETHEDIRQQFKPDIAPILHPTWTHPSENQSLLDLIKSQAAGMRSSAEGPDKPEVDDEDPREKLMEPRDDDDFVVV